MKVKKDKHFEYNFENSLNRLEDYLSESCTYEERDTIPSRDSLTFSNGYYVNCYSIFVDMRDSSKLPEEHHSPALARIYRSYISELVAIMQSCDNCREINIVGDCVSGIFSRTKKEDILPVFSVAYQINSIINILNYKLSKKNFTEIKVGIGIASGKALMVKAGYDGSGINDVVWMGNVVNTASNLCNIAQKDGQEVMVISQEVHNDLKGYNGGRNKDKPYQEMFNKISSSQYTGNVISINMDDWLQEQKKR